MSTPSTAAPPAHRFERACTSEARGAAHNAGPQAPSHGTTAFARSPHTHDMQAAVGAAQTDRDVRFLLGRPTSDAQRAARGGARRAARRRPFSRFGCCCCDQRTALANHTFILYPTTGRSKDKHRLLGSHWLIKLLLRSSEQHSPLALASAAAARRNQRDAAANAEACQDAMRAGAGRSLPSRAPRSLSERVDALTVWS